MGPRPAVRNVYRVGDPREVPARDMRSRKGQRLPFDGTQLAVVPGFANGGGVPLQPD